MPRRLWTGAVNGLLRPLVASATTTASMLYPDMILPRSFLVSSTCTVPPQHLRVVISINLQTTYPARQSVPQSYDLRKHGSVDSEHALGVRPACQRTDWAPGGEFRRQPTVVPPTERLRSAHSGPPRLRLLRASLCCRRWQGSRLLPSPGKVAYIMTDGIASAPRLCLLSCPPFALKPVERSRPLISVSAEV